MRRRSQEGWSVRELKPLRVGQLRRKFSHAGAQCADLSDQCVDGRLPDARRSAGGRSSEPTTSACAGRRGGGFTPEIYPANPAREPVASDLGV